MKKLIGQAVLAGLVFTGMGHMIHSQIIVMSGLSFTGMMGSLWWMIMYFTKKAKS